ncbi:monovalent cation/H(+) antiporter subunit G [Hyphomonas johnsonii]|jgi:multicomponent Na+:H+ antiporter subunit G|uniref:MnhG/PhaG family monovalent cation/proton antiporter n=1 Tax=Hyphomonas johnsonii MHS-2 TaxID=1280950 RepID=A0A059FTE7_9PROT|nr:monovalent cation/H(+) antiporter subunit G [Hyphomonas johnsonii]KCZ93728.1 MnhG/PhaG family monovalent cation/proton antiporter [Hyphomonas johnsonii MHS-2]
MSDFIANLQAWFEVVRYPAGAAVSLAGALLCMVGTIGVMRFPDFYTRLHAASITDTSGATLVLIGMALMAPGWLIVAKLLTIFLFMFFTSPTASHAVANAAHTAGLQPLIGPINGRRNREEDSQ